MPEAFTGSIVTYINKKCPFDACVIMMGGGDRLTEWSAGNVRGDMFDLR